MVLQLQDTEKEVSVPEQYSMKVYGGHKALPDALPSTEEPSVFVRQVDVPVLHSGEEEHYCSCRESNADLLAHVKSLY
jgi:hypothetical protein